MTGFISFTMDSFKKRRELFHLFLIQVFATFILYYLIVFSNIMTSSFYNTTITNILNGSVSNYWGAFFIILTVIALVFASALVLFTLRLMVFYQTKDISVMVAIGGILEIIENFYLIQLLIMVLVANLVGILFAYITVFSAIFLTNLVIPLEIPLVIPFPDYQLIIMFIIFFFSTYLIAGRLITGTIKKYHEELVQDKIDVNNGKDDNIIARIFIWGRKSHEGFVKLTTRISRLNIMRYSFVFIISLIINLLYAFFLVSVVFGTIIISDTSNNITYTGIGGDNTLMITESSYSSFFLNSMQIDSQTSSSTPDLSNSFFQYQNLLSVFKTYNVSSYDDRVVLTKNIVALNPSPNVNPNDPSNNGQNNVGSVKSVTPFIIALDPNKAISFWNYYGSNPKQITGSNIFVGEQFAYAGFSSPMDGQLYFDGHSTIIYTIKSIILDPVFKGNTVYMDIASYDQLFKPDTSLRNVIFLKLPNQIDKTQFINAITQLNPNLSVVSLNSVIQHNNEFDTQLSIYLFLIGIPLGIIYFVISDSYNQQIIDERKQQLNLIKILGGNKDDFKSIIIKEIDGFSFWGLSLGYIGAVFFIIQMTVPFPIISLVSILISLIIVILPYYLSRMRLVKRINNVYDNFIEA